MQLGNMNGRRVFLSGPMTGMPNWNRELFDDAEKYVRGKGARSVYNPAKLAPSGRVQPKQHAEYMRETLHELTASSDTRGTNKNQRGLYYDAIVLLPGWKSSVGARMEMAVAESIGMEVIEL